MNNKNMDAFFEAVTAEVEQEKAKESLFDKSRKNPNAFEHWYPALSPCFRTPKSALVPLTQNYFEWLMSDNYETAKIEEFGGWLKANMVEAGVNNFTYPLFLKGSCNSNKFSFSSCVIEAPDDSDYDIGKKALDTFYFGMCGDRLQSGFIFREYIKYDKRPNETIYSGLPLRCEFRVFYDFENHCVKAVFPYWDEHELSYILPYLPQSEKENYLIASPKLAEMFEAQKKRVEDTVTEALRHFHGAPADVPCNSVWSLDFLLDEDNELWFIDAAEGPLSAFWEKVNQ